MECKKNNCTNKASIFSLELCSEHLEEKLASNVADLVKEQTEALTTERDLYRKALIMLIKEDSPKIPCISSCNLKGTGVCCSDECLELHLDAAREEK